MLIKKRDALDLFTDENTILPDDLVWICLEIAGLCACSNRSLVFIIYHSSLKRQHRWRRLPKMIGTYGLH